MIIFRLSHKGNIPNATTAKSFMKCFTAINSEFNQHVLKNEHLISFWENQTIKIVFAIAVVNYFLALKQLEESDNFSVK